MMWRGVGGMDAARAAMGHGCPFAAGPWNIIGAREPRRSRGRMQGQAFLLTFEGPAIRAFEKSESPSRAKPRVWTGNGVESRPPAGAAGTPSRPQTRFGPPREEKAASLRPNRAETSCRPTPLMT